MTRAALERRVADLEKRAGDAGWFITSEADAYLRRCLAEMEAAGLLDDLYAATAAGPEGLAVYIDELKAAETYGPQQRLNDVKIILAEGWLEKVRA